MSGRKLRREGGASLATLIASSVTDPARNAGRPAISSNRMTPRAQMSVPASTSLEERICSGDM